MGYKVLIPQDITAAGKDYLKERGYEVRVLDDSSVETICREVKDCDAILARTAEYPRKVMEAGSKLKVIARYGAGVDNIDVEAAAEHGIWVCNAPMANSNSVAEHAVTLLLACSKNLRVQDQQAREGNFESRNTLKSSDVSQKVLGIVGCGHIGQLVAKKACYGLEMKVKGYDAYMASDRFPSYIERAESLDELFTDCDFISLHIPATAQTRNLVDKKLLGKMKKDAVLINCSRGGVVNEEDLYHCLKEGGIRGAGIDVFEQEPDIAGNPLFTLDNVIVSPHNAALTYEAMDQMGIDAARGIDEVLSGQKPTWPVNQIKC